MEEYKNLADLALSLAEDKGASYADVRIEQIEEENLSVSKGTAELIEKSTDFGLGIRCQCRRERGEHQRDKPTGSGTCPGQRPGEG
jgi:predicted Zn-dependent protease